MTWLIMVFLLLFFLFVVHFIKHKYLFKIIFVWHKGIYVKSLSFSSMKVQIFSKTKMFVLKDFPWSRTTTINYWWVCILSFMGVQMPYLYFRIWFYTILLSLVCGITFKLYKLTNLIYHLLAKSNKIHFTALFHDSNTLLLFS